MFRSYYPFLALLLMDGFGAAECLKLWNIAGASLEETFCKLKSSWGRREISAMLGRTVGEVPWDAFSTQLRGIENNGVGVLCLADTEYPGYFRDIQKPPPILFYKGRLSGLDRRGVAIVGTRQPSSKGVMFARTLARDISQRDIMVASGLARGIDTAAHEGSLEGRGPAVGVIGTGLDICYPQENRSLMEAIASRGCLISEQLMGIKPLNYVFPLRNRLISALSRIVVVVEAGMKSGAHITAHWAVEQGREVGAVPGFPGDFRSRGVNRLLKMGAVLVESVDDLLDAVPLLREGLPGSGLISKHDRNGATGVEPGKVDGLDSGWSDASQVMEALTSNPTDPDVLADHLNKDVSLVQSVLLELEMKGLVERDRTGGYFKR